MAKSAIPAPGSMAPDFALAASTGGTVELASFRGKMPVVLYFYPRADTPGCTKEACGFRDAIGEYTDLGVAVLGVSPDPLDAVRKFSAKFTLSFPLLADEDHAVCERYGVWQKKNMMGRKYMGVVRTTFLIGRDGRIAHVFEKVTADGHEQEVMDYLKAHPL